MRTALCTLFEGHSHYGVAALVNSLAAGHYQGTVWVGHRGNLPRWISQHRSFDPGTSVLQVSQQLALRCIRLNPPFSLNHYKPEFMRAVLQLHEPLASAVAYLDPDLVVKCHWAEIDDWLDRDSLALMEDASACLAADPDRRLSWQTVLAPHGHAPLRQLERAYHSGFVFVPRQHHAFLASWQRICLLAIGEGAGSLPPHKRAASHPFLSTDADALNLALSLCHTPLKAAGAQAIDFAPGGRHFSLAVGSVKPWQTHHLRQALRGHPPSVASRWYLHFAAGPLLPFSGVALARRRLSLQLAHAVGRLLQAWPSQPRHALRS